MAVYYAAALQRSLGRLITAKQVRQQIRGGTIGRVDYIRFMRSLRENKKLELERVNDAVCEPLDLVPEHSVEGLRDVHMSRASYRFVNQLDNLLYNIAFPVFLWDAFRWLVRKKDSGDIAQLQRLNGVRPSVDRDADSQENLVLQRCFTPSIASVLTISAPQVLLTTSVGTLLVGLGIYFGFTWTRELDPDAGASASRNVFIMYIVGLGTCLAIYSLSKFLQNDDTRGADLVLKEYLLDFLSADENQGLLQRWKVHIERGPDSAEWHLVNNVPSQTDGAMQTNSV